MRSEMDLLKMDERQRLAWLMANRGTLIAVGAVWIGMIAWELIHERVPAFLLLMVPVFAVLRAGLYFYYSSRPTAGSGTGRDPGAVRYGRALGALLLVAAVLLPVYDVAGPGAKEMQSRYVWDFVQGDLASLVPLALVYLWPVFVWVLARIRSRGLQAVLQFTEPFLAGASCIMILWFSRLAFESQTIFFVLPVPAETRPAWGTFLAVAANGIYLASWLAGLVQPWRTQAQ